MKHWSFLSLLLAVMLLLAPATPAAAVTAPDWDALTEEYLAGCRISDRAVVAIGYKNLVTGEEHYYNGDRYMTAASLYKLPLNMYYAARVADGEMEFTTPVYGVPYEQMMKSSLISSNNEMSERLESALGTYGEYRTAIAPLMDVDVTSDPAFLRYNWFTAEQVIACLSHLYEDSDRYPRVLDYMKQAMPDDSLFRYEQEEGMEVAHKYGFLEIDVPTSVGDSGIALNDCGIIFAEEPFALVVMTKNCAYASILGDYCKLMIQYTRDCITLRPELEAQRAAEEAAIAAMPPIEILSTEHVVIAPEPSAAPDTAPAVPAASSPAAAAPDRDLTVPLLGLCLLAMALALCLCLRGKWRWLRLCGWAAGLAALVLAIALVRPAPAAEPETGIVSAPAPTATPQPLAAPEEKDLIRSVLVNPSAGAEDVLALADYEGLQQVDGTACRVPEALVQLAAALPECDVRWTAELGGIPFPRDTETMDFSGCRKLDCAELAEKLGWYPALRQVTLCGSGLSSAEQESLVLAYPDIDFLWSVHFGSWTVRNDITCFSTLAAPKNAERFSSEDFAPLFTYCTRLRALDLSHQALTELDGLANLTELQVLLLNDNPELTDLSPLTALTELRHLECYSDKNITDFSFLSGLPGLELVNLSFDKGLTDVGFLTKLPALQMFWARSCSIPVDQWVDSIDRYPGVRFLFWTESDSAVTGWSSTERCKAVRKAFANWQFVSEFRGWDDIAYTPGAVPNQIYRSDL